MSSAWSVVLGNLLLADTVLHLLQALEMALARKAWELKPQPPCCQLPVLVSLYYWYAVFCGFQVDSMVNVVNLHLLTIG